MENLSASKRHAYIFFLDMHGYSKLTNEEQISLTYHLFYEISTILEKNSTSIIDLKTIGDCFIIYYDNQKNCIEFAMTIKKLFTEEYFWEKNNLCKTNCRIALHHGDLFLMDDKIEKKIALFGKSITTVARLEPIVRINEIWCTNSFKEACKDNDIPSTYMFENIGECELAKNWGKSLIWALYTNTETKPEKLVNEIEEISENFLNESYPNFYFLFIKLKDKHAGSDHLINILESNNFSEKIAKIKIEETYFIYGDFDVIIKIRSQKEIDDEALRKYLKNRKIISKPDDKFCSMFTIRSISYLTGNDIIRIEKNNKGNYYLYKLNTLNNYLKAFIYLESPKIRSRDDMTTPFINKIIDVNFDKERIINFYINDSRIIIEIILKTKEYYELSKFIESIEEYFSEKEWNIKSITYPVHNLQ